MKLQVLKHLSRPVSNSPAPGIALFIHFKSTVLRLYESYTGSIFIHSLSAVASFTPMSLAYHCLQTLVASVYPQSSLCCISDSRIMYFILASHVPVCIPLPVAITCIFCHVGRTSLITGRPSSSIGRSDSLVIWNLAYYVSISASLMLMHAIFVIVHSNPIN